MGTHQEHAKMPHHDYQNRPSLERTRSEVLWGYCGMTRIREYGQLGQGQCQESRPWKALSVRPRENMNNPPQVQGDYNTRGP